MEGSALEHLPFWSKLAKTGYGVLALDYDGTLAPFVTERDRALPYPQIIAPLQEIMDQGKTRLIIVSGREIAALRQLLPFSPIPELWGNHGHERLLPNGTYRTSPLSKDDQLILERVTTVCHSKKLDRFIEKKPASIALHWRGATAKEKQEIEAAYNEILSSKKENADFEIHPFDGGWELRHISCNKGEAIRTILAEENPETPLAYLGDDQTDEDAFKVLDNRGLTLLVRKEKRETHAALWIAPPEGLTRFFSLWKNTLDGKRG